MKLWIIYDEWNAERAFRHYRELKLSSFGFRVNRISEAQSKQFDKFYKEEYPDNSKALKM